MAIGINELNFDDDDQLMAQQTDQNQQLPIDADGDPIKKWMEPGQEGGTEPSNPNPSAEPSTPQKEEEEDIITLLLKDKNISDPTKIKFEDDEGNIEERDWNSLTKEEQLNILKTPLQEDNSLEEDEIGLINQIRLNQMTPEEFINAIKQQGAAEYAQALEQSQTTRIDDLTNDELFILDLQSRVEDITTEEAQQALERAKQDQNLFDKQMNGIREEYKRIEEERTQMEELEQQQRDSEQFEEFKNAVIDSIQSLDRIGSLDISMEDDDMNEIANFILSTDSAGVNYLSKALDDPQTLVRMAWFALKGEEAIDSITEYFTEEIKKVSQARYKQGLKDGKAGKKPQEKTSPVVVKPQEKPAQAGPINKRTIDDLD